MSFAIMKSSHNEARLEGRIGDTGADLRVEPINYRDRREHPAALLRVLQ